MNARIYIFFFSSSLFILNTHAMQYITDTAIQTLNYTQRQLDPQSYATKASNKSWTEELAKETDTRLISDLNKITITHDGKNHPYSVDMTKRSIDKLTAIIQVLVTQSLEENPSKQNPELLKNILAMNYFLIPDLHYLLALKALEAQKKETAPHSGDSKVDVLLHKVAQLSNEQRTVLITQLTRARNIPFAADILSQQCVSLSDAQWQEFLATVNAKRAQALASAQESSPTGTPQPLVEAKKS